MNRGITLLLATGVFSGGALLSFSELGALPPQHVLCRAGFCAPGPPTVESEPLNPFGWCDLAEDKASAGDIEGARKAFAQAVRLGPHIPPVLIRAVNFEVSNGKVESVFPSAKRILTLTPAYDGVLFRYLTKTTRGLTDVQTAVIPDPGTGSAAELARRARTAGGHATAPEGEGRPKGDAARAWVSYLIAERHPEAGLAWHWVEEHGAVTAELRNEWIEYLVNTRKDYAQAQAAWVAGNPEDRYPQQNRIFNSAFGREFTPGRMDWNMAAHPHVTVRRGDGLTVTFDGKANTAYGNLTQQTYLPAGRWRFEAEAAADGLTTNKRPYFRIYDTSDPRRLDVATPMAPEKMEVEFTAPAGGSMATVMLVRQQSEKFDNQIAGVLRIRQVRIRGVNGGQ